jgi:signal transduction histidine kinase
LELAEEPLDLAKVIEDCKRLIADRVAEGRLTLETGMPPDMPKVRADKVRLKQILLNLLSNAVKFTPEGGRVRLVVELPPGRGIVLSVIDNGIGMEPEQIPLALEPFRQLDGALNRRFDGTGLGLPLARRLTELHGGALEISSTKAGGTVVRVRLPESRLVGAASIALPKAG